VNRGAQALRDWRKAKGISQTVFAEEFGVYQVDVSKWESGRRLPNLLNAFILEDFTGVDARLWLQGVP
jgi:transcriptional regulator with XRE-family HTH domain